MTPKEYEQLKATVSNYYKLSGNHSSKWIDSQYHRKIEVKINKIIDNEPTDWRKFVAMLVEKYGDACMDRAYIQFPSYVLSIITESVSNENYKYERSVELCLSMLTPHFTIYYKDNYIYINDNRPLTGFKFIYKKSVENKKLTEISHELVNCINHTFQEVSQLSHFDLFSIKVEGVSSFIQGDENYFENISLFGLLFNGHEEVGNFDVLY